MASIAEPDDPLPASRLTAKEREALSLLAQGHTVKSIAALLDTTPGAINERLREARRKTGVGSSRELARLLETQENRHNIIEVADPSAPDQQVPAVTTAWTRPLIGVVVMIALLLIAAGAVGLVTPGSNSEQVDPLLGHAIPAMVDPAGLHAKVRAEQRDAAWAAPLEQALINRSLQLPVVGKDGNALRVTCGSSLCEIAGTLRNRGPLPRRYDPELPANRAVEALQTKPYTDDIAKLGLKSEGDLFTGVKDRTDTAVFMLYYSRLRL